MRFCWSMKKNCRMKLFEFDFICCMFLLYSCKLSKLNLKRHAACEWFYFASAKRKIRNIIPYMNDKTSCKLSKIEKKRTLRLHQPTHTDCVKKSFLCDWKTMACEIAFWNFPIEMYYYALAFAQIWSNKMQVGKHRLSNL